MNKIAKIVPEILFIIGMGSFGTGLWMYQPWISLSVCGGIVAAVGLLIAK